MPLRIPGTAYAVVSAFAWALSTLLVNRGLDRIERGDNPYDVTVALASSLLTGCVLLSAVVVPRFDLRAVTATLVLAGLFTFPVGTGLYYFTAELYLRKSEIAAQFVQVKPLFSVTFAVLLGEQLSRSTTVGLGFVAAGLVALLVATVRGEFHRLAAVVGLVTALSWAIGEAFMKLGVYSVSSLTATYVALVAGTAVYLAAVVPVAYGNVRLGRAHRDGWLLPFVGHGVLSVGVAYTAFFTAIKLIGLAQTALVTAFWPAMAIGINFGLQRLRGHQAATTVRLRYFLPASVLLLLGSALAAI